MTAIIDLSVERNERNTRLELAWQAFQAASLKAQDTLDMKDGMAAGRAWRRWLELFMTEEQNAWIGRLPREESPS